MGSPAVSARPGRPTGMTRVAVPDVATATWYYQRFFDFGHAGSDGGGERLVGHGVVVHLAEAAPDDDPAPQVVILLVDRPAVLRRRLDDLGAHLVDHDATRRWPTGFAVRDHCGNILVFRPTSGIGRLRGATADRLDRIRRHLSRSRTERQQRQEVGRLRSFLDARATPPGCFFVHAHGGQLHWLATTVGRIPARVEVVVLASDMTPAERAWTRRTLGRPVHDIDDRLDDSAALEILCAAADADFGWIELGCLILDASVLDDLVDDGPDVSFSGAWAYDSGMGFPVLAPYLLYVRVDALRLISGLDARATAGIHSWERSNRQVEGRRCYSRVPSGRTRRLLSRVVQPGPDGLPRIPADLPFFEVTVLLQLLARVRGRRVRHVRDLSALGNARGAAVQDEYSDELVYIGALSYADPLEELSGYFHDDEVRQLYLLAEFVVLIPQAPALPEAYAERAEDVRAALVGRGIDPGSVSDLVVEHLVTARGLSRAAAGRVTNAAAHRSTDSRAAQEDTG